MEIEDGNRFGRKDGSGGCKTCVIWILVAIVCLLTCILVPLSIASLEYFEMGFRRNKATGTVDTSKVYFGGIHFVGVLTEFKKFRHSQFRTTYNNIAVFNKEKLHLTISCSLQFILRPEDLKLLHDAYDINYEPIIVATASAAIKGAATKYTIDEFRLNRTKVALGMKDAVADILDGGCCRKDCKKHTCRPHCKPYSKCKDNEKGLFSSVTLFQLKLVDLSKQMDERFLRMVVEQELKDTEMYKQREQVIRKQTVELRSEIENQANEITQNAIANSTLINANAHIQSQSILANSQNSGLSIIYDKVNIINETHKKTLDYVRTLRDRRDVSLYIGFEYMVAKP